MISHEKALLASADLASRSRGLVEAAAQSLRSLWNLPSAQHLSAQLCHALCDPISSDGTESLHSRAGIVCKLPIFLAESELDSANPSSFRALLSGLALVLGAPLQLQSPPVRLDLDTSFVFHQSIKTAQEVAEALCLPEVKEILTEQQRFFDMKTWLRKQVLPHLADMTPADQDVVLTRFLPLEEDIDMANTEPFLVPAEARARRMLPPCRVLDPQDFTIQEVFGVRGDEWPALDAHHFYHFPSRALSSQECSPTSDGSACGKASAILWCWPSCARYCETSINSCLASWMPEVFAEGQRYGEIQRGLMQRIVESWGVFAGAAQRLIASQHKEVVLQQAFVDISSEADGGEASDTLFAVKSVRGQSKLFRLNELVSGPRLIPRDPYLCWTTLPLSPRGFPDFESYRSPSLQDVAGHALALGSLPEGAIVGHLWEDLKEKVVAPLCEFLAQDEAFKLNSQQCARALSGQQVQLSAKLRKVKFIAVQLDEASGARLHFQDIWQTTPAPQVIQVPLLRMLGVRDAVELPDSVQEADVSRVADEAMTWLFENGPSTFSDVTVRCDGGCLFLHRNILMARSEYFKAMFQGGDDHGFRESQESGAEVTLYEFPLEVAKILFGYVYHGKVDEVRPKMSRLCKPGWLKTRALCTAVAGSAVLLLADVERSLPSPAFAGFGAEGARLALAIGAFEVFLLGFLYLLKQRRGPKWQGANIKALAPCLATGWIIRFLCPVPAGVTEQAWSMLAIFVAMIVAVVVGPLPPAAVAVVAVSAAVFTGTVSLAQGLKAFTDEVVWLVVIAFFFAEGFQKRGPHRAISAQPETGDPAQAAVQAEHCWAKVTLG
ncbi:unnamed protein product [Effrenium voratum]|nr:unnamed protein product [Effrenium voratum]